VGQELRATALRARLIPVLRLLGVVYLAAFVSFAVQAQGLIGSHGILPLAKFTEAVAGRFGAERFLRWSAPSRS
jgi:hypothetical protein